MSQETTQPPDLSSSLPPTLTMEQGVEMWLDQMDCVEQFLLAGLARQARDHDELRNMYADWYHRTMEEHDRTVIEMMRRFEECQVPA